MKKKVVELIYHTLQVQDFESYKVKFQAPCQVLNEVAKEFEVHSYKSALFNGSYQSGSLHYHFVNQRFYKLLIPFSFHRKLKRLKPDYVLVHGTFNHFQIVHLRWLMGKDCKLLVQHHGETAKGWIKQKLLGWSSTKVNAYLFTSPEAAFNMGLPQKKIHLIMEGSTNFSALDKLQSRSDLGLAAHDKIYLWVGRLIPVKNPLFFLKTFTEFSNTHPEVKLYLFYHDEALLKECRQITRHTPGIVYMGKVEHETLRAWYSAADYFVSASLHEGSGYALCEAMACGCIPIVSSIGAFQFMTNNGESALMYEAKDAQDLMNTLKASLNINTAELSTKVLKQFKTRLSVEAISGDLINILRLL
jgi:glycosyltransferase involved in cell wall biosynthesis